MSSLSIRATAVSASRASRASRGRVVSTRAGAQPPPPPPPPLFPLAGPCSWRPGCPPCSVSPPSRWAPGTSTSSPARAPPEIAKVLDDPKYPPEYPFGEKEMQRYDESSDFIFYSQPRFVRHIDDDAIKALTKYYASVFPPAGRTTSPSWTCAAVGSATTPRDTPPGASPGSA